MALSYRENCMILTSTVLTDRVTDKLWDKQTDGRAIAYSALSIIMLSRAKK